MCQCITAATSCCCPCTPFPSMAKGWPSTAATRPTCSIQADYFWSLSGPDPLYQAMPDGVSPSTPLVISDCRRLPETGRQESRPGALLAASQAHMSIHSQLPIFRLVFFCIRKYRYRIFSNRVLPHPYMQNDGEWKGRGKRKRKNG